MSGWNGAARVGLQGALLAGMLLASACTEAPGGDAAKGGTKAAGEVQGGTISDAMIPLEQLESQSPLAPRQAPAAGTIDDEQPEVTQAPGVEGEAPTSPPPEPQPAPQAAPEATEGAAAP